VIWDNSTAQLNENRFCCRLGTNLFAPASSLPQSSPFEERFLKAENRALVLAGESPAELLQALEEWRPTHIKKGLSRETRRVGAPRRRLVRTIHVPAAPARKTQGAAARRR
jgi:hypothetical protein